MPLILRSRTHPFKTRIARSHKPSTRRGRLSYPAFKDCLRWEFGFTCAICLLHEAHFVLPGTGAATSRQMTIEHIILKSTPLGQPLRDTYTNCLLICAFCNTARGDRYSHIKPDGTRLLNPVDDVWTDHFVVDGDRLEPKEADSDAEYTRTAYAVNDAMRTLRRRALAELIDGRIEHVRDLQEKIEDIERQLGDGTAIPGQIPGLLTDRGRRLTTLQRELDTLDALSGVPLDAPPACRCVPPSSAVPTAVSSGWQLPPSRQVQSPLVPSKRFRV